MKKTFSFVLAALLTIALAVPAFAEEEDEVDVPGDSTQDVTATYKEREEDTDVETVYFVTVAWDVESTLSYYDGTTTYTWNADETMYEANDPEDAGWDGEANVTITVTNKSNAAITATASWADAQGITATCIFENDEDEYSIDVESADEDTDLESDVQVLIGAPVDGEITATVTVDDGTIDANNAVVGTITVSISAKND